MRKRGKRVRERGKSERRGEKVEDMKEAGGGETGRRGRGGWRGVRERGKSERKWEGE